MDPPHLAQIPDPKRYSYDSQLPMFMPTCAVAPGQDVGLSELCRGVEGDTETSVELRRGIGTVGT